VDFAAASPAELREALTAVLEQPGYRTAAAALAEDFRAAGGAPQAARRIEEVAA
jgi:UDP:flavonoid glycosyltransferase YjiC (YdhE family)